MPEPLYKNITNNEYELLQRVAQGDSVAFTSLVDDYWNNLYSQALTYLKNAEKAQELTQDIFLKIWEKRTALAEVGNFKNYLFIVAKNHLISSLRKKVQQRDEKEEELIEQVWVPDRQLQYKESYEKIITAIEKLPPVRQAIFKMSRLDGMSYEEISKSLGISPNTVKGHIVLALIFLRNFIKEDAVALILLYFLTKSTF